MFNGIKMRMMMTLDRRPKSFLQDIGRQVAKHKRLTGVRDNTWFRYVFYAKIIPGQKTKVDCLRVFKTNEEQIKREGLE